MGDLADARGRGPSIVNYYKFPKQADNHPMNYRMVNLNFIYIETVDDFLRLSLFALSDLLRTFLLTKFRLFVIHKECRKWADQGNQPKSAQAT